MLGCQKCVFMEAVCGAAAAAVAVYTYTGQGRKLTVGWQAT